MIHISKPELLNTDGCCKLQTTIETESFSTTLWFSVPRESSKYLCYERGDAFLVAILPYAIQESQDIILDAPISERLYYSLTTHLIPAMVKVLEKKNIVLTCPLDANILSTHDAVGTAFSGGVDSFLTVKEHLDTSCPENYRLTHLAFFNVGSNGSFGGDNARSIYNNKVNYLSQFAKEINLPFITLDSNIGEFYLTLSATNEYSNLNPYANLYTHIYRICSAVLALQKLFKIYYCSSSIPITRFNFNEIFPFNGRSLRGEYYILDMLSTENTRFFVSGEPYTRIDKIEKIVEYEPVSHYLNVCEHETKNCSRCEKCIVVLITLDILGKLPQFQSLFNVPYYLKNKGIFWAKILQKTTIARKDILALVKRKGYHIPPQAYILSWTLATCRISKQLIPPTISKILKKSCVRSLKEKVKQLQLLFN